MKSIPALFGSPTLLVSPWTSDDTQPHPYSARSDYVEWFWLPVLGPSTTWLLRRIDASFDEFPSGFMLDAHATARALGIAAPEQVGSTYPRTLHRLTMFGLAKTISHAHADALLVRRMLPAISFRHLQRLAPHLQRLHDEWLRGQHRSQHHGQYRAA